MRKLNLPWFVLPVVHWYVWIPLSPSSRHWLPPVMAIRSSAVRNQLPQSVTWPTSEVCHSRLLVESGVALPYLERAVVAGVAASVEGEWVGEVLGTAEDDRAGTRVDVPVLGTLGVLAVFRADGATDASLGSSDETLAITSRDDHDAVVSLGDGGGRGREEERDQSEESEHVVKSVVDW